MAPIVDDTTLTRLRLEADRGTPQALYQLATALVTRQEVAEAFDLHRRAAQAGHANAQIETARMLMFGMGSEVDVPRAAEWLVRAEAAGSPIAGYFLALMAVGNASFPREGRINERLLAAVNANYPPALRAAAIHFGRKPGEHDQTLCLQLLERAAQPAMSSPRNCLPSAWCAARAASHSPKRPKTLGATGAAGRRPPAGNHGADAAGPGRTRAIEHAGAGRSAAAGDGAIAVCRGRASRRWTACFPRTNAACWSRPRPTPGALAHGRSGHRLAACAGNPHQQRCLLRPDRRGPGAAAGAAAHGTAARVGLLQAEHLTVLRYEPGQEYRPHRDYRPPSSIERDRPEAGNRLRTICVYLNHVEAGGETEFPIAGAQISPQPGRAVIFDNLFPDGAPGPGLPARRPAGAARREMAGDPVAARATLPLLLTSRGRSLPASFGNASPTPGAEQARPPETARRILSRIPRLL